MAVRVSELSVDELRVLIQETVRQTLTELFRDPDDGLELHEDFAKELKASLNVAPSGRKLLLAESVAANLGLKW